MVDSNLIRFIKSLERDFKEANLELYEEDRLEFFRMRGKHIDDNIINFKK